MLFPVVYSPNLFDITKYILAAIESPTSFNNLFGILAALHKSLEWEYEKEWRLLFNIGETVGMQITQCGLEPDLPRS